MIAAKVRALHNNYATIRETEKQVGVSQGYINQASIVLQYAPDLVDAVMAGAPLNAAYATAQKRKIDAQSEESKLERLRADAPDLADQVAEEKLTLAEAIGALNAREQDRVRDRVREEILAINDETDRWRQGYAAKYGKAVTGCYLIDELLLVGMYLEKFNPPFKDVGAPVLAKIGSDFLAKWMSEEPTIDEVDELIRLAAWSETQELGKLCTSFPDSSFSLLTYPRAMPAGGTGSG